MRFVDAHLAAVVIIAAPVFWAGSAAADADEALSCAELAHRQAEQQFGEETAALEDRTEGQMRNSNLQREFLGLDAESYRRRLYEDCVERRGDAPTPAPTQTGDD